MSMSKPPRYAFDFEMAPKLCDVCSQVPPWLASLSWEKTVHTQDDTWEKRYTNHDPTITLRSWKDMQAEAKNTGCDLCRMIIMFTSRSSRSLNQFWGYLNLDPRDDEVFVNTPLTFRRGMDTYKTYYTFQCVTRERIFSGTIFPAPSSWRPRFLPLAGYNKNDAEFNVLLMKDWLDHCQRNHTKCKNISSKDFLPTRLLDVEAFKCGEAPYLGNDVKLVCLEISDFEDLLPSYITLSHCWGPPSKRPTTTTKANLVERMTRIPFLDLPKTFQDAVDITRKLVGQRYLWIDSLCIIQDSEQDWACEAGLMAKVYSCAYCTLAALSSKDGSEGLQQFEIQDEDHSFVDIAAATTTTTNGDASSSSSSSQYRIFSGTPDLWSSSYNGSVYVGPNDISPLRFRAWVLQERELSRRTIHFSKAGLLWECAELKGTAQLPWQDSEREPSLAVQEPYSKIDEWRRIQNSPQSRDLAAAFLKEYRLEERWWRLVADYRGRLLTKETDRLIALSGVAQAYQEQYFSGGKYGAGLWCGHLPEGLLWYVQGHRSSRPAAAEYVAPSWSWASVRGSVWYELGSVVDRFKKKMGQPEPAQGQRSLADRVRDELKVEEMSVSPKYEDVYGALSGAVLVLSGARMVEVDRIPEPVEGEDWKNLKRNGVGVASLTPDVADVIEPCGGVLMCLGIRHMKHFDDMMEGLLLKEIREEEGVVTYRRVGFFNLMSVSLFEGVEPRRIILK